MMVATTGTTNITNTSHAAGVAKYRITGATRTVLQIVSAGLSAIAASVAIANRVFEHKVRRDVVKMFEVSKSVEANADAKAASQILTEQDIVGLPEPVQRWLRHSQVLGKERATSVRLKQRGLFRMRAEMPWLPIEAMQYYTVDPPGFVWYARLKLAPFIWVKGEDEYKDGKGHMLIKLLGMFPLVDMQGPEIDQATLVRFLSEIVWFPSAALSDYIKWEDIDDLSARATMSYGDVVASANFYFDEHGALQKVVAERYRLDGKTQVLNTWETPVSDERDFAGRRVASKGEVVWKLPSGDLPYGQLDITDIEYNHPALYDDSR